MELLMKKSFNYLAITSCFVLGTALAHADADSSQGDMAEKMFKAMDSNTDGMVTREEFSTFGDNKFKEMDVNGNGQITLEEMKAGHRKMMSGGRQMDNDSSQGDMAQKMFKAMDTNSDGMVTREEFRTFGDKKFKEMDVNGNGQITLEEMKAGHRKMMSGGRQMDDQDYKRMGDTRDQNDDSNSDKMRNDAWQKKMDDNH